MNYYISDGELTFDDIKDAFSAMELLIKNGYVCMLSREEELYILNYSWNEECSRNGVVFMSRDIFEGKFVEVTDWEKKDFGGIEE